MNSQVESIVSSLLKLYSRTKLPKIHGEIKLRGISDSVEIYRDQWGIPHIYAKDETDLFFAQGFVHAQDRLWQMEFNRRLVAGRLSEVMGSPTVMLDRWLRTLTMRRVAEFEAANLDLHTLSILNAYAAGVNTVISLGPLPIEFSFLRYKPEPWVLADTLSWIKMMSWSLSVNWESEILRAKMIDFLGPELAAELECPHLSRWTYVVPPGTDYSHIGVGALERSKLTQPFTGPSPYEGLGSNNWVLTGSRTSSGMPILANDMHLSLGLPSIWYENHLVGNDLNVTGISFPGIPGIISGHNGHVAWGYTNGFPDVQDLYIERLRRMDDGSVQAEYNNQWENVKVLREIIHVKGAQSEIEEVIITRHGPIINNLAPDFCGEEPLALRWTSLEPDQMIQGLFNMMTAKDCYSFHQSLRNWTAPVQNVVYADTTGNIGYTFPGKIPIRAKGNGRIPVPGWHDEFEWIGYIPFESLPHMINPSQGFIATANNRAISNDYPIDINLEPISGDRAQRISELIIDGGLRSGEAQVDIPYIINMQFDQISPSARVVARHLGNLTPSQISTDNEMMSAIRIMREWDGALSSDSVAAVIYQVFIRQAIRIMIAEKFSKISRHNHSEPNDANEPYIDDLIRRMMGVGPTPILAETSLFGERWLPWLTNIMTNTDNNWFNLGGGEKRDDIMTLALRNTIEELKKRLGSNMKNWSWGDLHSLTFAHSLSQEGIIKALFNRGPYAVGGDHTTIWMTGSPCHEYDSPVLVGPPYRMIVDLGNLENSVGLLVPGQSGNPSSPFFDDQIDGWFNKEYHPLLYKRKVIKRKAKHRLTLIPK